MAEQQQERAKVRVACTIVNGVELRLSDRTFDDGTGMRHAVPVGEPVRLNGASALPAGAGNPGDGAAGVTEVDAEWWGKWLEQNQGSPLLAAGAVKAL
jgi:hypothetical protein